MSITLVIVIAVGAWSVGSIGGFLFGALLAGGTRGDTPTPPADQRQRSGHRCRRSDSATTVVQGPW